MNLLRNITVTIIVIMVILYPPIKVNAEEKIEKLTSVKNENIYFGFGYGVGLAIGQEDCAHYEDEYFKNKNVSEKDSTFLFNQQFRLTTSICPANYFEFEIPFEFGFTGSTVEYKENGSNQTKYTSFMLYRYSAGLIPSIDWNSKDSEKVHSVGIGVLYHYMVFREYEAATIGYRLQYKWRSKILNSRVKKFLQGDYGVFFNIDIAQVKDRGFQMSFTGFQVGVNYYFLAL